MLPLLSAFESPLDDRRPFAFHLGTILIQRACERRDLLATMFLTLSRRPPTAARWLLEKMLAGQNADALIGDLDEQFAGGRSAWWYWRQTIVAIKQCVSRIVLQERLLSLRGVFAGWALFLLWLDAAGRVDRAITFAWIRSIRQSPFLRLLWLSYGAPGLLLLCLGAFLCGWVAARVARRDKTAVVWICAALQLPMVAKVSRIFWSVAPAYNTTAFQAFGYHVVPIVMLVGLPLATVLGGALAVRRQQAEHSS